MNKKGVELTMNTIVIAVIVLVALAIILIVFAGIFGRGAGDLNCVTFHLDNDLDGDNVKDAVDVCPCNREVPSACTGPLNEQKEGCPGTGKPCASTNCNEQMATACKNRNNK